MPHEIKVVDQSVQTLYMLHKPRSANGLFKCEGLSYTTYHKIRKLCCVRSSEGNVKLGMSV